MLSMCVGGLVGIGVLGVTTRIGVRIIRGRPGGAMVAGAFSGLMTAAAGVGGPALAVYALGTGWNHRAFVATCQLHFAAVGAMSIAMKGFPSWRLSEVSVALTALIAGAALGHLAEDRLPIHHARVALATVALLGAVATIIKGVTSL